MHTSDDLQKELSHRHEMEQDRELRIFRTVVICWMILCTLFFDELGITAAKALLIASILAVILLISIFRLMLFKPKSVTNREKYLILVLELFVVFFVVLNTGGAASPFFWVYPISLVLYAVRFPMSLTLSSGLLMTLLYVVVIVLNMLGITETRGSILLSIPNILLMWIVAAGATVAVRQLNRRNREIWEHELKVSEDQVKLTNEQLQQKQAEIERINETLRQQQIAVKVAQQKAEMRIHELAHIRSLSDSLLNTFQLDDILKIGAEKLANAISCHQCDIYIFDENDVYSYLKKEFSFEGVDFLRSSIKISPANNPIAEQLKRLKQPLLIQGNIYNEDYKAPLELLERYGLKSTLLLPIYDDVRLIAIYGLNNADEERDFTQNEIQLADTLVTQIKNFIGRAKLFQESEKQRVDSEKRAVILQLVNRLTQLLTSTLDSMTIFNLIVKQLAETFEATRSVLFLCNRDNKDIVTMVGEYDIGAESNISEIGKEFSLKDHPITRQAVLTKKLVQIDDPDDPSLSEPVRVALNTYGIRSMLVVPMVFQDEVLGVIALDQMEKEKNFSDEDVSLISTLVNEAAIAVINSQLYSEGQRSLSEREFVLEVMHESSLIDNLGMLLKQLAIRISMGVKADQTIILLHDSISNSYEVKVNYDFRTSMHEKIGNAYKQELVAALFERPDKPCVVQIENATELASKNNRFVNDLLYHGVQSFYLFPLTVRNKTIGLLLLCQLHTSHRLAREVVSFTQGLAEQTAIAIHDTIISECERKRARYWESLIQISHQIATIYDLKEVVKLAADTVETTFKYENVLILFVDAEGKYLEVWTARGRFRERLQENVKMAMNRGMIGKAVTQGKMVLANDVRDELSYFGIEGLNTQSELSIPIKVNEQVMGVLNIECDRLNAFDEIDSAGLQTVADQLALAVRVTRFIEKMQQGSTQKI